jgi:hypothetical protein
MSIQLPSLNPTTSDDERVLLPVTDRMAKPRRVHHVSLGMLPAVHVDDPPDVRAAFVDHHDALLLWHLQNLHRNGVVIRRGPDGGMQ